jgi:hypothetical protein
MSEAFKMVSGPNRRGQTFLLDTTGTPGALHFSRAGDLIGSVAMVAVVAGLTAVKYWLF